MTGKEHSLEPDQTALGTEPEWALGSAGDLETHEAPSARRIAQPHQIILHRVTVPSFTRARRELFTKRKLRRLSGAPLTGLATSTRSGQRPTNWLRYET